MVMLFCVTNTHRFLSIFGDCYKLLCGVDGEKNKNGGEQSVGWQRGFPKYLRSNSFILLVRAPLLLTHQP